MFCFQCEQTAACKGCTGKAGVCGKPAAVADLQDQLTGALIGLARTTDTNGTIPEETWHLLIDGLFMTVTNVNFDAEVIQKQIEKTHAQKNIMVPNCDTCDDPCGRNEDYDLQQLWGADEDIRSLKSLILFGLRGMAAYAHHAWMLGFQDPDQPFLRRGPCRHR